MCSITKDHLAHFPSKATKSKKLQNQSSRKFVIFRDIELICSNIRKILKFSQKKYFLLFTKTESFPSQSKPQKISTTKKNSLYVKKWNFLTLFKKTYYNFLKRGFLNNSRNKKYP